MLVGLRYRLDDRFGAGDGVIGMDLASIGRTQGTRIHLLVLMAKPTFSEILVSLRYAPSGLEFMC